MEIIMAWEDPDLMLQRESKEDGSLTPLRVMIG